MLLITTLGLVLCSLDLVRDSEIYLVFIILPDTLTILKLV